EPLELTLSVEPGYETGRLDLVAVGARLAARLTTVAAQGGGRERRVHATATLPPGSWSAAGGSAEAELRVAGDSVVLEAFTADVAGLLGAPGEADGGLRAELSGRLSPRLDLAGTLASPRLPEPVAVTVDDRAGPSARLAWRELTATPPPTDGVSVALDGRAGAADLNALAALLGARLPAGLRAELAGADTALELQGLAWSGAGGWAGAARLHAAPPQLGDLGPLTLRASA